MEALGIMVITLAIIMAAAVMWWVVCACERLYSWWEDRQFQRQMDYLLRQATRKAYAGTRSLRISHR